VTQSTHPTHPSTGVAGEPDKADTGQMRRRHGLVTIGGALVAAAIASGGAVAAAPAVPVEAGEASAAGTRSVLHLPRVPWEGGSAYWSRFPEAHRAGWDRASFFPTVLWYGSCNPDQYVFDKAHGINTYAQCNPETTYDGLAAARMSTLFTPQGQPARGGRVQVGTLLDDEVDGRYEVEEGLAHMRALARQYDVARTGRFTYANWTGSILTGDRSMKVSTDYYDTVDVNSVDAYLLSVPQCDWTYDGQWVGSRYRVPAVSSWSSGHVGLPISQTSCRTPSSYGKLIDLQLEVNRARGQRGPLWGVHEVISTGGGVNGYRQPTGAQVKAAAMNSVIHEARGLMWFSQAPDQAEVSDCVSGDAFRDARVDPSSCGAANVAAVGQVNHFLQSLAPVINTRSYVWSFGPGTDTMLKVHRGAAYVFAMAQDGGHGTRTFTLPPGVTGRRVVVVGENRTLPVRGHTFTDTFADDTAYHVYRVRL
jgi:hypothetical protein